MQICQKNKNKNILPNWLNEEKKREVAGLIETVGYGWGRYAEDEGFRGTVEDDTQSPWKLSVKGIKDFGVGEVADQGKDAGGQRKPSGEREREFGSGGESNLGILG